ncbi:NUP160 isoform 5, partial [Pongo abelii]
DGGKMAAAGALERSFVELSGAERERPRHFREFTVCSIGTANAVTGAVKYSESAGGFYYVESGKLFSVTRNRFIHWYGVSCGTETEFSNATIAYRLDANSHQG